MSRDNPDHLSMLIGLHRLEVQRGDCLLPELHDLIANRNSIPSGNIVLFPVWWTRRPDARKAVVVTKVQSAVVAFPSLRTSGDRKDSA